jgi:hypothetical protein
MATYGISKSKQSKIIISEFFKLNPFEEYSELNLDTVKVVSMGVRQAYN